MWTGLRSRERENRRKPLLPCDKHLIFRKSSKSCPEWVHRQTDRETVKGGDRQLASNQGKPWSRPTKTRVSRSLWQRKWHTHAYWERHTHTYTSLHHTHTATAQYTWGIKAISWHTSGRWDVGKNANPPNWARQQLRNRRKCQKQHTHTHILWNQHTHTHVSVKNIKKSEKGKRVPRVFGANFSSSRNFNGKMLICFCIEGDCVCVCVCMCVCTAAQGVRWPFWPGVKVKRLSARNVCQKATPGYWFINTK